MTARTLPHRPLLLRSAIAVALLTPALALAQEDEFTLDEPTTSPPDAEQLAELTQIRNTLEFGLGYISDDAVRFGRRRGFDEQGGYGVLRLEYLRRGPHDGASADYVRVRADDLGLRSREARVEFGRQGDYRVRIDYDQMPTRRGTVKTPFTGIGGNTLTLPAGWVAGANTAAMTRLLPNLGEIELEVERRRVGLGLAKLLPGRWELTAGIRHEERDGLKSLGGVIGNSGGNPRAALLPEPIDHRTREFDAAARYAGRKTQFELRYHLSGFDNANTALTWQNPFAQIAGWAPGVGYPGGQGRAALPPDNRFHQASALGGWNVSARTRVTADIALGRMTQNDPFLPYTVNPVLAASIVQPLPRASLDGRIDTTVANLRISSRPHPRLHWAASYRYDDRDNRTPRDEYVYIGGDSQNQDASATSSRRRFNEPASFREQRLRVEAGWRIDGRTRLSGAIERRQTNRTYSVRERADEDLFSLSLQRGFGERVDASLTLSRADRSGSTYHGSEPFLSGYAPAYTATVPGQWDNPPGLRRWYLADRERERAQLRVNFTPTPRWTFGLDGSWADEDYTRSELGLTAARARALTLDAAFVPAEALSFHGFYSRETFDFDQTGASIRTATRLADAVDPARRWRARHRDEVDSAGLGVAFKPRPARYQLGADLLYARSDNAIDLTAGSALNVAALPPNTTRLDSLSLHGGLRLQGDWSVRLRYWYERYRSTDWALDGVAANQLANVILLAEDSPDYRAHVVAVSLVYRF
ncbi:MtrB/PioB family decaheme-associated outer membrane protein [Rehaibacterium terrae]|jgi:MtrB/PioB family decaheme-associated outer membrane protein|uniref:MtrB/PioB family decaheme-associated outer membrane protein n=1 Tax=Rehaibacterium terrae TaxID=1341696 RepID=A0A7W7XYK0_9GAMM|nr:MtrB/PioB family decaheme-associated outer membrane protein [Rehaibacterium terrae]MBB5014801.1 MtrB/PioB family decaheme-associated outer membrane protein [Rehaibacterium terrae]